MKERNELYTALIGDIRARTGWEERQRLWYEMRHGGLRRKRRLPWQADLHYPLSDSIVSKLKPFYYQQIYGNELIATFAETSPMADEKLSRAVSIWFDYHLKQKSNIELEILTCIDHLLTSGLGFIKVSYDSEVESVHFDAVDPINVILPYYSDDMRKVERMAHVMHMSTDAYKSNSLYNQEILEQIGGRQADGAQLTTYEDTKLRREGITVGADKDQVVVWEVYERDPKTGVMHVHTFSPAAPELDVRPTFELPFEHGQVPFIPFVMEVKDKGVYSSRGICEVVAPFESYLCKLMNEKADAITLYNRPMFRSEQDIPNSNNFRFGPATVLPVGVAPVPMPQPPISFDHEMTNQRMIAEYLVAMPDFGMGQQQSSKGARTATEITQIGALMGQSTDLRARVFRLSLAQVYRQAWSILCQFAQKDLTFMFNGKFGILPEVALQAKYAVIPSGSADGVNKAVQFQKAVTRMQMFANNPSVDQVGLIRSVLEQDDPALANKLVVDNGVKAMSEAEEQAMENLVMESGVPAAVEGNNDHVVHIQTLVQRVQQVQASGTGSPQSQQLYSQHLEQHLQALGQRDKNAERAIRKQLGEMSKAMAEQQAQQQAQQQGQPPAQQMA